MSRRLIALMIAALAIVFAFGALSAIRWPSIMMFVTMFIHPDPALGLDNINWRELGIVYGAPYFLASLCYYAAAVSVASRRPGSVIWYAMGMVASLPIYYLVDFEQGFGRIHDFPNYHCRDFDRVAILVIDLGRAAGST